MPFAAQVSSGQSVLSFVELGDHRSTRCGFDLKGHGFSRAAKDLYF
jgi:hypothetical protein